MSLTKIKTASFVSIIEILQQRQKHQGNQIAYYFHEPVDGVLSITYAELDQRARMVASALSATHRDNARALLLFSAADSSFLSAFFGCLYAGLIAVPTSLPGRASNNLGTHPLHMLCQDAQADIVLTSSQHLPKLSNFFQNNCTLINVNDLNKDIAFEGEPKRAMQEDLAILQYTSGSTGEPKGVMISHGNLIHNSGVIQNKFGHSVHSRGVIWLPYFHDMGLIGGIIQPLFSGFPTLLMPPLSFMKRPYTWLKAISDFRATTSGGPNFAYEACINKISDKEIETLDLSSWDIAFCGAEPINPDTLRCFSEKFTRCGFRPQSFYPCYGLAEATLIVSGGEKNKPYQTLSIDRNALSEGRIQPVVGNDAINLVSCGTGIDQLRIVEPDSRQACAEDQVGEIWLSSDSVSQGYWHKDTLNQDVFHARLDAEISHYFRTGDLGFLHEGNLYITGRLKDVIIVRGVNHYPHDIEATIADYEPRFPVGSGVAFGVSLAHEEQLVLVYEGDASLSEEIDQIAKRLGEVIQGIHQITLHEFVLIRRRTLTRTTSGKVQRRRCQSLYQRNELQVISVSRASFEMNPGDSPDPATSAPQYSAEYYRNWLLKKLSASLNRKLSEEEIHRPFSELGVDSLKAVQIACDLEALTGKSLSPTLIFDFPTIDGVAHHLARDISHLTPVHQHSLDGQDAIAIIGMGCRYPGSDNPEAFWNFLEQGRSAVIELPDNRWPEESSQDNTPAKPMVRWGGFLQDVELFDESLFSISSKEAQTIDPQQRLLLEVAWQTLENAGYSTTALRGSSTGVFIGISASDYMLLQYEDQNALSAYSGTGNAHSIAANRISFCFDFRGPSMAVDTACSSSLVAIHQACHAIDSGDCEMALVGACNLMLTPHLSIIFSQANMMAADGRCKVFDEQADGYVRGEGCGMIMLKRLSAARRDGDAILALIRGSSVNQDGRSNGLTAPNKLAQQAVIHKALERAGLSPEQLSYLETHGTGTRLGDLIEYQALEHVFAGRTFAQKLPVGSIKTNIGHLEAAAGMAGLMKAIFVLQQRCVPPHLNLHTLNKQIDPHRSPLCIPIALTPLKPASEESIYAGVSSFGFGGTNAHIILESYSEITESTRPPPIVANHHLLCLSAHKQAALQPLLEAYESVLDKISDEQFIDLCYSANTRRTALRYRIAIVGNNREDLKSRLKDMRLNLVSTELPMPSSGKSRLKEVVFMLPGQGTHYWGMGAYLYTTQPVFRAAIERCNEIAGNDLGGMSLIQVLYEDPSGQTLLTQTRYAQPCLFAFSYAAAEMWKSWGIQPSALVGHSVGEYVAACLGGALSLEEALRCVMERARLIQKIPTGGAMMVVFADYAITTSVLSAYENDIEIAAINNPTQFVLSGPEAAIEEARQCLSKAGIHSKRLNVSHAFHSRQMDVILDEFTEYAEQHLHPHALQLPLASNITGEFHTPEHVLDAVYWRKQLRGGVLFGPAISRLIADGYRTFLDLSPDGSLAANVRGYLPKNEAGLPIVAHRRGNKEQWQILEAIAQLYGNGFDIDFRAIYGQEKRRPIQLPNLPLIRQRHWISKNISENAPISQRKQIMFPQKQENVSDIVKRLTQIIAKLLHSAPHDIDPDASFLELGSDSLILMEAIVIVQDTYSVPISIADLLGGLNTLTKLAEYIANLLPANKQQNNHDGQLSDISATVPPVLSNASPSVMPSLPLNSVEQLFHEQLKIMRGQLDLLGRIQAPSGQSFPQCDKPSELALVPEKPAVSSENTTVKAVQPKQSEVYATWLKRDLELAPPGASNAQKHHLEYLTRLYTARTVNSKRMAHQYRPVLADNRASAGFRMSTKEMLYPIVGTRAEGALIWDVDGNKYIDFTMGFGTNLLGHSPAFITEAISNLLLKEGFAVGPQSTLAGRVAQKIARMTGAERVAFCNSGSEAIMTAVRLARAKTKRNKIVIFNGSYHGTFDGVLGRRRDTDPAAVPIASGTSPSLVQDVLVLDYDSPASLDLIQLHGADLAAVLIEPVQSRRPGLQPKEFLQQLKTLSERYGFALIWDETITGFRIAPGGAQSYFGIQADIATYGKIVGGGLPIGVIAGKAGYLDAIDGGMWEYGDHSYPSAEPVFFAGTFSKHPLTMAAANAILDYIQQEGSALYDVINTRTASLASTLNEFFIAHNVPISIHYFGSLFRFVYQSNYDLLFVHLALRGIYIWEGRNCFISTAHTEEQINTFITAVKESILILHKYDYFPSARFSQEAIEKIMEVPSLALSDSQKRFAELARTTPSGVRAGNIGIAIELKGAMDRSKLQQALNQTLHQHESLCVGFDLEANLHIYPKLRPLLLQEIAATKDERQALLRELMLTEFKLDQPPLLSAYLIREEEDSYVLCLVVHHLIADGWSLALILKEISNYYHDTPSTHTALNYSEYVYNQANSLKTNATQYWLDCFPDGIPIAKLPHNKKADTELFAANSASVTLSEELTKQLYSYSRTHGVTPFMCLFAAFQRLVSEMIGQQIFTIGVPMSIRTFPGSEYIIGTCINLLPILCSEDKDQQFTDSLSVVRKRLLDAYSHADFAYPLLGNACSEKRSVPPVTISFNVEPCHTGIIFPQHSPHVHAMPVAYCELPLMVNILLDKNSIYIQVDYQYEYFNAQTISEWLQRFSAIMTELK